MKPTSLKLSSFIGRHRGAITAVINSIRYRYDGNGGKGTIPTPPPTYTSTEIREWILNEECLYHWAREEGVKL